MGQKMTVLNPIINFLIRSQRCNAAPILPVELIDPCEDNNADVLCQNLNGAFLILLAGERHPEFSQAQAFIDQLATSHKWGDWARFYLTGTQLIAAELEQRWEVPGDLNAYVGLLLARRSSSNGVFGFKAHFPQIQEAVLDAGADLFELFPGLSVVYIHRSDRVSQAVSLELAARSGVWTDEPGAWQDHDVADANRFRPLWRRLHRILGIEAAWEEFRKEWEP